MTSDDALMREMLDEHQLRKLVHSYCVAVDGDAAEGEVYTIATHTFVADGRDVDVIVGGRYLDRYEKRDGTWKILERVIVTDTAHVNDPSTRDLSHPITRGTPVGTAGDDDPSERFFTLLRSAPAR